MSGTRTVDTRSRMSIWKRDANEVMDQVAHAYIKWVSAHRWVHIPLTAAVLLEVALFWVFLGRGWGEAAIALMVLPVLFGWLVAGIKLRPLRRRH